MEQKRIKNYGVGLGLRFPHFPVFLDPKTQPQSVDWVEVVSENFMHGRHTQNTGALKNLLKIRERYPVALHGVSLSLGSAKIQSAAPYAKHTDAQYLKNLKQLIEQVDPIVVSDHLCWTRHERFETHDLNPLPYTWREITHVIDQIKRVQDFLGRSLLIENVSSYVTFAESEMTEQEFLTEVVTQADCGILLDINNVFVNSVNHGFDPRAYLQSIPHHRVGQIHLAGHDEQGGLLIDTHDHPVRAEVWELFEWYGKTYGHASAMIERDAQIPEFHELEKEILILRQKFTPHAEAQVALASQCARVAQVTRDAGATQSSGQSLDNDKLRREWVSSLLGEFTVLGIASDTKMSAQERFGIYEYAFWARQKETIESQFPDFVALAQDFDELIPAILGEWTSQSYTLDELGYQWLEGLRARAHPHLEVAQQDWAKHLAYLSRGISLPAGVEEKFENLGQENPEEFDRISLVLHPSLQVLESQNRVYWFSSTVREKVLDVNDWPAMVALMQATPLSQWEQILGLTPGLIQAWTQEGLICGYRKNAAARQ